MISAACGHVWSEHKSVGGISPMKVLHIITDTNIGGAGRYLLNLLTQPAFSDIDVTVACPDGELGDRLDNANIGRINISGRDVSFSGPLTIELLKIMRGHKPDLVHTHSSLSGRIAAKILGIPVVYTKHGQARVPSASGQMSRPAGPVKQRMNRMASRILSDKIIAISDCVRQDLIESGVDPSRVVCILNGIEISQFGAGNVPKGGGVSAGVRGSEGQVMVGTVARLHPVKALDVFVEAARITLASFPNARFIIGGTGPMEDALRAKIRDLKLEPYVKMAGFVEDVPEFLAGLDIFVLSSDAEGLGLVVLEAMAQELPVVATAVGGVPEAVKDEETGFLVPPRNARLLAQSIARLAIDPDMAARMGAAGRKRAEELFDAKLMAQKTVQVYRQTLKRGD